MSQRWRRGLFAVVLVALAGCVVLLLRDRPERRVARQADDTDSPEQRAVAGDGGAPSKDEPEDVPDAPTRSRIDREFEPLQDVARRAGFTFPARVDPAAGSAGAAVVGRVVDDAGEPAVDIGVRLADVQTLLQVGRYQRTWHAPVVGSLLQREARTDAKGEFRFEEIMPGMWLLSIGARTARARFQRLGELNAGRIRQAAGGEIDVGTLSLPWRWRSVRGRLVDRQGMPVSGATVLPGKDLPSRDLRRRGTIRLSRLAPGRPWQAEGPVPVHCWAEAYPQPVAVSKFDGSFVLNGVLAEESGADLVVMKEGFLTTGFPLELPHAGEVKDLGIFELRRGAQLSGRVTDVHDRPLSEVRIHAGSVGEDRWGPPVPIANATTAYLELVATSDGEGRFEVADLAAEPHLLAVESDQLARAFVVDPIRPGQGPIVIRLPTPVELDLYVIAEDGGEPPVPSFSLLRTESPVVGERSGAVEAGGSAVPGETPERHRIVGLEPGQYSVTATAPGFTRKSGSVDLTNGSGLLVLSMKRLPSARLRVLEAESNEPVANATVVVGRGDVTEYRTDERGTVRLPDSTERWFTVTVRADGFLPRTITAVRRTYPGVVLLSRPGELGGQILVDDRSRLEGLIVLVADGERSVLASARVGTEGRFVLRGLAAGELTLHLLSHEGELVKEQAVEVPSGGRRWLEIELEAR